MEKKIRIRILSRRHESTAESINSARIKIPDMTEDPPEPPDEVEMTTEGILTSSDGRWILEYDETDISGLEGSHTRLVFDENVPDALTMMRRGSVSVTMVFSPGLRHVCRYETGIIPFELTLMTHKLINTIPSDGKLLVEYTTELAGGGRSRTKLTVAIRELDGDAGGLGCAWGNF